MASQYPSKRILVVDDNRDAADLATELLCLYGHVAAAAYGGKEAIQTAIDFMPDVVLLDLGMPVIDGFAVAIALRQVPALNQSVLIAYSAWNDARTRARVQAGGFDNHLVKPAKLDDILRSVATTSRPN